MAYCTIDDVRTFKDISNSLAENQGSFNDGDIKRVIDDIDIWIDGQLSTKYIVPIKTNLDIMKVISQNLSAYEIMQQNTGTEDNKEGDRFIHLKNRGDELLNWIIDGTIKFDGATVSSNVAVPTLKNITGDYRHFGM